MKRGKATRKKKRPVLSPARRKAARKRLESSMLHEVGPLTPPDDELPSEEFMRV